jgi:glucose/arabinose dehydrogenase
LRDADGDGVAEIQEVFLEELNQPFGMAMLDDTFYVGNTDGLVARHSDFDWLKSGGSSRGNSRCSRRTTRERG